MLLDIYRNECCEAVSSKQLVQVCERSTIQSGDWYEDLEGVWMRKSVDLLWKYV